METSELSPPRNDNSLFVPMNELLFTPRFSELLLDFQFGDKNGCWWWLNCTVANEALLAPTEEFVFDPELFEELFIILIRKWSWPGVNCSLWEVISEEFDSFLFFVWLDVGRLKQLFGFGELRQSDFGTTVLYIDM